MTNNTPPSSAIWIAEYVCEMERQLPEQEYRWINQFVAVHLKRHIKSFLLPKVAAERDARCIRSHSDLQITRIMFTMGLDRHQHPTGLAVIDNGNVHFVALNGQRVGVEYHRANNAKADLESYQNTVDAVNEALAGIFASQRTDVVRPDGGGES